MKKILLLMLCFLVFTGTAFAKDAKASQTVSEEAIEDIAAVTTTHDSNWVPLLENKMGIYAYDKTSLGFVKEKDGIINKSLVEADVQTAFLNEKTIKQLNSKYSKKIKKDDTTSYCVLHMVFNMQNATYKSTALKVYTLNNKIVDDRKVEQKFLPIPKDTFAEVMYNIAKNYSEGSVE